MDVIEIENLIEPIMWEIEQQKKDINYLIKRAEFYKERNSERWVYLSGIANLKMKYLKLLERFLKKYQKKELQELAIH
mgnify:CR=1 FL=1